MAEICRKAEISHATYFNWRKKNTGVLPDKMRRLMAPEDENSRLERTAERNKRQRAQRQQQ